MRLKPRDIEAIKIAVREAYGETAVVSLFGSRVHDELRGGDIDLLVEADADGEREWQQKGRFLDVLFRHIDEQKVDVVLIRRGAEPSAFARLAARDAVPLP